ncbi:MAG: stage III sporulation protein AD [Ruminiclostridium sp.]|nr:stage III sporulation protein AD [Ruminiclostridium sp.]
MDIAAIVGIGIVAAAVSSLLKRFHVELGLFVSVAASLLILLAVLGSLAPLTGLINELAGEAGTDSACITILMKALAVSLITQLAADSCRDSGEGAIASKIELAGRTAVLLLAVPLFESILGIVKELIT